MFFNAQCKVSFVAAGRSLFPPRRILGRGDLRSPVLRLCRRKGPSRRSLHSDLVTNSFVGHGLRDTPHIHIIARAQSARGNPMDIQESTVGRLALKPLSAERQFGGTNGSVARFSAHRGPKNESAGLGCPALRIGSDNQCNQPPTAMSLRGRQAVAISW